MKISITIAPAECYAHAADYLDIAREKLGAAAGTSVRHRWERARHQLKAIDYLLQAAEWREAAHRNRASIADGRRP